MLKIAEIKSSQKKSHIKVLIFVNPALCYGFVSLIKKNPNNKPPNNKPPNKLPGSFISGQYCISMCVTMRVYISYNRERITWHYEYLQYVKLRNLDLVNMHGQDGNFKKGQMLH